MEIPHLDAPHDIELRPATIFAFIKTLPFILCAIGLLFLACRYWPGFLGLSFMSMGMACYRFVFIRRTRYMITPEVLRISSGIFFKRTDFIELYRLKDYVITRPVVLQIFGLMDVELISTDPENPIVWLRGIPFSDLVDTIRGHVQDARIVNKIYEIG